MLTTTDRITRRDYEIGSDKWKIACQADDLRTAVKASSMRVHASSCRVIAQMIDQLAAGQINGIR